MGKQVNADHILAFCHFLVLIQESNQRKSRIPEHVNAKGTNAVVNASTLQTYAHPAIFSAPHTWNNSLLF
jgi:hypothetical protein